MPRSTPIQSPMPRSNGREANEGFDDLRSETAPAGRTVQRVIEIFQQMKQEDVQREKEERSWLRTNAFRQANANSEEERLAWKNDFRRHELKKHIIRKLQDRYLLFLQKTPPSSSKIRPSRCAHPLCPAPDRRIPSGAYRLSLEPRRHLDLPKVPTVRRASASGSGGDDTTDVTWFCLSCVEELWNGSGLAEDAFTGRASTSVGPGQGGVETAGHGGQASPAGRGSSAGQRQVQSGWGREMVDDLARPIPGSGASFPASAHRPASSTALHAARLFVNNDTASSTDEELASNHNAPLWLDGAGDLRPPPARSTSRAHTPAPPPHPSETGAAEATASPSVNRRPTIADILYAAEHFVTPPAPLPPGFFDPPTQAAPGRAESSGIDGGSATKRKKTQARAEAGNGVRGNKRGESVGGQQEMASKGRRREKTWCFCERPDDGSTMIGCDGPNCKIKWFHLACLGLKEPPATETWTCSMCTTREESDNDEETAKGFNFRRRRAVPKYNSFAPRESEAEPPRNPVRARAGRADRDKRDDEVESRPRRASGLRPARPSRAAKSKETMSVDSESETAKPSNKRVKGSKVQRRSGLDEGSLSQLSIEGGGGAVVATPAKKARKTTSAGKTKAKVVIDLTENQNPNLPFPPAQPGQAEARVMPEGFYSVDPQSKAYRQRLFGKYDPRPLATAAPLADLRSVQARTHGDVTTFSAAPVAVNRGCPCGKAASRSSTLECHNQQFCAHGWFHWACLHLDHAPRDTGPWYCPSCRAAMAYRPKIPPPSFDGGSDASAAAGDGCSRSSFVSPSADDVVPPAAGPFRAKTALTAFQEIFSAIEPELRDHGSGFYRLTISQQCALAKWKSSIMRTKIFEDARNYAFMEQHGLLAKYAVDDPEADLTEVRQGILASMEAGGFVVELRAAEVKGQNLSVVMSMLDRRVQAEVNMRAYVAMATSRPEPAHQPWTTGLSLMYPESSTRKTDGLAPRMASYAAPTGDTTEDDGDDGDETESEPGQPQAELMEVDESEAEDANEEDDGDEYVAQSESDDEMLG